MKVISFLILTAAFVFSLSDNCDGHLKTGCLSTDTETFTKFSHNLGINEVNLIASESKLIIDVVNPYKLTKLRKEFHHSEEIQNISTKFLDTPLELFEAIKHALSTQSGEASITLDEDSSSLIYQSKPFNKLITMMMKLEKNNTNR